MATIDEILGNVQQPADQPVADKVEPVREVANPIAKVDTQEIKAPQIQTQTKSKTQPIRVVAPAISKVKGAEKIDKKANAEANKGVKALADEQKEARMDAAIKKLDNEPSRTSQQESEYEKRKRNEKLIAAIGDGLSSVANLYYTTQGALDSHTPGKTLSKTVERKWQKFEDDAKADLAVRNNYLMHLRHLKNAEAAQKAAQANNDRDFKFKVWAAGEKAARQAERDKIKDKNDAANLMLKTADLNRKTRKDADDKKNYEARTKAITSGKKGTDKPGHDPKRFALSDNDGHDISIHKDTWSKSWHMVYDHMCNEIAPTFEYNGLKGQKAFDYYVKTNLDTPEKKEAFVAENWYKYPKSINDMYHLATVNPTDKTEGKTGGNIPEDPNDVVNFKKKKK